MFGSGKPLNNPINWSFRVGRLFGIDIRVHIAFVLCVVVLVSMELPKADSGVDWSLLRVLIDGLGTYAILFLIVLLHEFGHCFGARSTGGEADEILLWPLGGLAMVNPPHNASAHMVTTVAGPAVNVLICAICAPILALWMGSLGAVPWNPLHPFEPVSEAMAMSVTEGQSWLLRVYGISYFILLINLVPVFPFDGGRVVQAWLWPRKGYAESMMIATSTGMIGAIAIGLFALILKEERWLLLMIAVFGYMTCWQTRNAIREQGALGGGGFGTGFGGDYGDGLAGDNTERKPGFLQRRREQREAKKALRERARIEAEEQAVEEVLGKVSDLGMASLTSAEKKVLERATQRQRSVES